MTIEIPSVFRKKFVFFITFENSYLNKIYDTKLVLNLIFYRLLAITVTLLN